MITVKGLVDREKGDFYTLTVVADDGGPKVDSTVVSGSWVTAPPPSRTPQNLTRGQQRVESTRPANNRVYLFSLPPAPAPAVPAEGELALEVPHTSW